MAHSVPEPFGLFPLHPPLPTAVWGLLPGRRFSCILWGLIWVVVDPPEPLLLRGLSSRMVTLLLGDSMWSCPQPFCRRLARRSQRGVDCAQTYGEGAWSGASQNYPRRRGKTPTFSLESPCFITPNSRPGSKTSWGTWSPHGAYFCLVERIWGQKSCWGSGQKPISPCQGMMDNTSLPTSS